MKLLVKTGNVLLALLVLIFIFLPVLVFAQNVNTFIPNKAYALIPSIVDATDKIMPGFNRPQFFSAQAEHESCITLKHSRCLEPTSELKSAREQGVGIGQITRTFRVDGTIRFDILTELRTKYPSHLRELTWNNVKQRPDLQVKALVLLFNDGYKSFNMVKDPYERTAMAAAAYNGGSGHIHQSRRLCGLAKNCDPQYWFGNVENHSVKSTKPIYGNRSPRDINTHYPIDVLKVRLPKYERKYLELGYNVTPLGLKP